MTFESKRKHRHFLISLNKMKNKKETQENVAKLVADELLAAANDLILVVGERTYSLYYKPLFETIKKVSNSKGLNTECVDILTALTPVLFRAWDLEPMQKDAKDPEPKQKATDKGEPKVLFSYTTHIDPKTGEKVSDEVAKKGNVFTVTKHTYTDGTMRLLLSKNKEKAREEDIVDLENCVFSGERCQYVCYDNEADYFIAYIYDSSKEYTSFVMSLLDKLPGMLTNSQLASIVRVSMSDVGKPEEETKTEKVPKKEPKKETKKETKKESKSKAKPKKTAPEKKCKKTR